MTISFDGCKTEREREDCLMKKYPEEFMEQVCMSISHGGSLIELCKAWRVKFGRMLNWIRLDDDRSIRYNDALNSRNDWAKERILIELKRIGTSQINSIYDDDGEILPIKEWPDEVSSIVKSVEFDEGEIKKIAFWNKEKCLELLGKTIQMFIDRVEHTGKVTLEDVIADSIVKDDGP